MLVVLDPGFFREDGIHSPDPEQRRAAGLRLRERLEGASRLLSQKGTALVVAAGEVEWFNDVYNLEARVVEGSGSVPEAGARPASRASQEGARAARGAAPGQDVRCDDDGRLAALGPAVAQRPRAGPGSVCRGGRCRTDLGRVSLSSYRGPQRPGSVVAAGGARRGVALAHLGGNPGRTDDGHPVRRAFASCRGRMDATHGRAIA